MMDERIETGRRYVTRTILVLAPNLLIGAAAMEFVIGVNGVVGDDLTWQLALLLVVASGLLRNGPLASWMNLFAALLGVRMMDIPAATPCWPRLLVGLLVMAACCILLRYVSVGERTRMGMAS